MRRILTRDEIEMRDKRRNKILTIVMLLILVVSSASYAFLSITPSNNGQEGDESGQKIQNYGNQWVTNFGGNQHIFSSSPESALNVTSLNFIPDINKYIGKPLYIDSKSEIISAEIASNLGYYAERVNKACYGACNDSNLPEKNCTDNLIVYINSDNNAISQKDNCIFIEGDIRAVDAFLYREIGIS